MKPKYLSAIGYAAILLLSLGYLCGTIINLGTGYDHARDPLLGLINPDLQTSYLVSVPFAAFFSALLFLGLGMLFLIPKVKRGTVRAGAFFLMLAGMSGSLLVFFFPSDQAASAPSNMGLYHLLIHSILIILLTIAIFLIGQGSPRYEGLGKLRTPSLIIAFILITSDMLVHTAWVQDNGVAGIISRITFLALVVWIFWVARMLFRRTQIKPI